MLDTSSENLLYIPDSSMDMAKKKYKDAQKRFDFESMTFLHGKKKVSRDFFLILLIGVK